MLEGSTAAYDVLTRLVNIERDADSMGKAVAARVSDLQARKARADKRKEMARTLMLKVMSAANIKKASLVEATLSISRGRDSVEVTDIDALADEYIRIERIPDKKALLDILRSDGEIPGARLKMGGDTMTVRVA
jgi:formate dehydrogenase maturation protein FdhE